MTPDTGAATPAVTSDAPGPVVFRTSPLTVLGALAFAVCATPVAFGAPWLWLIYLLPLGLIGWVLRVRTTAGPDGLVARGALRSTRVAWADVSALRLRSSRTRSRVSAVLGDGPELPLPAVRVRDLPRLSAASGGRLPDPGVPPPSPTAPGPSDADHAPTDHAPTDHAPADAAEPAPREE